MSSFLKKVGLFFIPFYIALISFFIFDPFKVLYHYDLEAYSNSSVTLNTGYISATKYLQNSNKYNYDAFIFGSSRTKGMRSWDWKKHIDAKEAFVFSAAGESLYGVQGKVKLIDNNNDTIKYALFLFDVMQLVQTENNHRHINIQHPAVSQENKISFYFSFVRAYLDLKFIIPYFDLYFTKKYKKYMNDYLKRTGTIYAKISNDWINKDIENKIKTDSINYYRQNKNFFYKRDNILKFQPVVIQKEQRTMLNEIKEILKKHKTDYKIIILPMYDQYKFNKQDLTTLNSIFGKENIYDFSGINKYTNSIGNYYEPGHFRDVLGKQMLDSIYFMPKN